MIKAIDNELKVQFEIEMQNNQIGFEYEYNTQLMKNIVYFQIINAIINVD